MFERYTSPKSKNHLSKSRFNQVVGYDTNGNELRFGKYGELAQNGNHRYKCQSCGCHTTKNQLKITGLKCLYCKDPMNVIGIKVKIS